MKTRTNELLLFSALALSVPFCSFGAQKTGLEDIDQVVRTASAYESGQSLAPFREIEILVRNAISKPSLRPQVEAALRKLAAPSASFECRRFACKQLGIIGSQSALPDLANMLREEATAGIACLALSTYPAGKADEILRAALNSSARTTRLQILNTLGDRRDPKSVKVYADLVHDGDPATRESAAAALGKMGNRAAWEALDSLRRSPATVSAPVLAAAMLDCADRLVAAKDHKTAVTIYEGLLAESETAYVRRSAFQALCRLDQDKGEQRILAVIHGQDAVLKPVAIGAVREIESSAASAKFGAELSRLQIEEQVWMIDSLAARGDSPAQSAIEGCFNSPESTVRQAAIAALGRMGDAASAAHLARALAQSRPPEENRAIESALVALRGGAQTDVAIAEELRKSRGQVRAYLITALARRQGAAANPVLLREAGDRDSTVAKAAFRALARTAGVEDLPAMLSMLNQLSDPAMIAELEGAARQALARIERAAGRSPIVLEALRQANSLECRCRLLGLLPSCGDAAALTMLRARMADPDARIREAVVSALAEWPDNAAWDPLAAVLRHPESDALRAAAFSGLIRFASEDNAHPDARLFEHYRQLLAGARGDADLKLVLGALAGAAHPDALELIYPSLASAGVRAEAEVAVKRIAESIKTQNPQAAREALQRLDAK